MTKQEIIQETLFKSTSHAEFLEKELMELHTLFADTHDFHLTKVFRALQNVRTIRAELAQIK